MTATGASSTAVRNLVDQCTSTAIPKKLLSGIGKTTFAKRLSVNIRTSNGIRTAKLTVTERRHLTSAAAVLSDLGLVHDEATKLGDEIKAILNQISASGEFASTKTPA
jgi:hypothetical protein